MSEHRVVVGEGQWWQGVVMPRRGGVEAPTETPTAPPPTTEPDRTPAPPATPPSRETEGDPFPAPHTYPEPCVPYEPGRDRKTCRLLTPTEK